MMKTCRAMIGTCIAVIALHASAMAEDSKTPDVAAALDSWVAAVESASVDNILALYADDAIMYSAFAVAPLDSKEALREYYERVVVNPDIDIMVTENHVKQFGNVALNSGLYTLKYTQDGEPMELPSRYSFVYGLKDGKWVIVDHHSSSVPIEDEEPCVTPSN